MRPRGIRRFALLAALFGIVLLLAGCGYSIETTIAKHYPRMGDVVDNTLRSGEHPQATGRYYGSWYLSTASVSQTAQQIAALRRPASMTPLSDQQMALWYDGFNTRVVMIYPAAADAPAAAKGHTVIEVLTARHAYYSFYPFMVGYWGGYSPYYRRYGRAFQSQYGYNTTTVSNDGTVRHSTVGSSTSSFRGGGPGWGK